MSPDTRCSVSLVKGEHRYVFVYPAGQEARLLACLLTLADDPQTNFDWLDAAVLSYQIGQDRVELWTSATA